MRNIFLEKNLVELFLNVIMIIKCIIYRMIYDIKNVCKNNKKVLKNGVYR